MEIMPSGIDRRPQGLTPARGLRAVAIAILVLLMGLSFAPAVGATPTEEQLQEFTQLWAGSAHALANVNCSACHLAEETQVLVERPTLESCQSCHENQVETFLLGKHGIRLQEGLSPLTPDHGRLPMAVGVQNRVMNCNTCHDAHSVNTLTAAVDSCLSCHQDQHSLNYKNSAHAQLFAADSGLPRPSNTAVSCATCHLPRQDLNGGSSQASVVVNHNNTLTLKPRDRMVSEVCMNCHGMEYSYNSIFDDELVELNFDRPPKLHLKTLDMVRKREQTRSQ